MQALPPPVEVLTVTEVFPSDPTGSDALPTFLSSEEPKPGEPLNEEQEEILAGGIEQDQPADPGQVIAAEDGEALEAAALMSELSGFIEFDEDDVRGVLEDSFSWLAKKFESDHWLLTERQSRMLGRPTTKLLGTVWTSLAARLPDFILKYSATTPGLAGTILAAGIVVGPKAVQQIVISKNRKVRNAGQVTQEPIEMPQRQAGPVGSVKSVSPLQ